MNSQNTYVRDLLLIGGGHAHVQVLRRFGMNPEPGIRLTMVSRESESPYTGMLPGYIAKQYSRSDICIDLLKLSNFADCRFIRGSVVAIDNINKRVILAQNRPPLRYDKLSLNCGGDSTLAIPGSEFVYAVKPIGRFLEQWESIYAELIEYPNARIAIIGGGAGSVELALAIRQSLPTSAQIELLSRTRALLPTHRNRARKLALEALRNNYITFTGGFEVSAVVELEDGRYAVQAADNERTTATHVFSVVGVHPPDWIRQSNLEVDEQGFLRVNQFLQAENDDSIFGAGDMVSMADHSRPKSGVYAVRHGPILAENLRQSILGKTLNKYRPQRNALALLRSDFDDAIASRGLLQSRGLLAWLYKDWIDRRFMRRFRELPDMKVDTPEYRGELALNAPETSMRCGGCGAKLGADLLQRVLHRLDVHSSSQTHRGIGDDAAIVNFGSPSVVMSCDGFRSMIDDPWLFGRIAAHHALNDLYAMGSEPTAAMAMVSIPFMSDVLMEDDLYQVMSGALSVFKEANVDLVGGHSAEGVELTLGFSVFGGSGNENFEKGNLNPAQALVLTKPIGVGAILAGGMDGRCPASAVNRALDVLDQSNAAAMYVFMDYDVRACTDITGFGLVGHLAEMLRASNCEARISLEEIPILPDALVAMSAGVFSSLQVNNEQVLSDCRYVCSTLDPRLRMLADPQTSGGLLAAVEPDYVNDCIVALQESGYVSACQIGTTSARGEGSTYIEVIG